MFGNDGECGRTEDNLENLSGELMSMSRFEPMVSSSSSSSLPGYWINVD
jgi:hypothetical protein